jgi:hypothetical protein
LLSPTVTTSPSSGSEDGSSLVFKLGIADGSVDSLGFGRRDGFKVGWRDGIKLAAMIARRLESS